MKDLIMIGTYIPDSERERLLSECVESLQNCRDKFDLLICSHSYIPKYISEKCDYVLIENNNDLIHFENMEYINQPWFLPYEGYKIFTTVNTTYSTFLSCYRLLIMGIGFGRNYNYKKIHYIEYDSFIRNCEELYENSLLLNDYDGVFYNSKNNGEDWFEGNYFCFLINKTPNIFQSFDRELLLNILKESNRKSNEYLTYKYFTEKTQNLLVKDMFLLDNKITTRLSDKIKKEDMSYWTIPYFDKEESKIKVISWNDKNNGLINVTYIINNEKIITHNDLNEFHWKIDDIGDINDIHKIIILINDKIKTNLDFKKINKEMFIKTNYGQYDVYTN
jgi:hypothetical protein